MCYQIVIYCPDKHISYNLNTLEFEGVGGGITARIRVAHALAARGHDVSLYINCPDEETIQGVRYIHFSRLKQQVETDIFVASTSGGEFDLSFLYNVTIHAKIFLLTVVGIDPPKGLDCLPLDFIYAPSNFIRHQVVSRWAFDENKLFVSNLAVEDACFIPPKERISERDPKALVYVGHPSKGLNTAIKILRILRGRDTDFKLHIYGGSKLWGQEDQPPDDEPGVIYHGMIGQRELANRLKMYTFSMNMQAREEPYAIAPIESMRAGCIVIASSVGAYPEAVRHGYNGFLVKGNHENETTQIQAADLIFGLVQRPDYMSYIRRNAKSYPMDWHTIAEAWEKHWDWVLEGNQSAYDLIDLGSCPLCGSQWLPLADGLHCTDCGRYQRNISGG